MNDPTAAQLLKHSLDTFLAEDIEGWARLCAEDIVVEFPFATFATFRNGLIVNYREYWNPMAFMAAMSGATF